MSLWPKRPPEKRTSVTTLRIQHSFNNRLLLEHENLDLIDFFKVVPRSIIMDVLMNWITIDTLCIFDTAVSAIDSRRFLLQDVFLDETFVVFSNKIENLVTLRSHASHYRQDAVYFARWLHLRQIFVRVLDFTHWNVFDRKNFLEYLWQYEVENERYKVLEVLHLPEHSITFDLANVVGSKLKYLWYLNLSHCGTALGDCEFKNLVFTCLHLEALDISHCYALSSEAITFMAKRCPLLKNFVFFAHNCDSYGFIRSLDACCPQLLCLDLRSQYCPLLTHEDVTFIEPGLHFRQLRLLNFSGCEGLHEAAIYCLVSAITTLEYFTMIFEKQGQTRLDPPPPISDVCIVALACKNRKLKELYLRGCTLVTNVSLRSLSLNCKSLGHVDVSGTNCSIEGFKYFKKDFHVKIQIGDHHCVFGTPPPAIENLLLD